YLEAQRCPAPGNSMEEGKEGFNKDDPVSQLEEQKAEWKRNNDTGSNVKPTS
ncbi:hypothetical protein A2U01_0022964, partial [Trifolium medium]|nr:hypothetical protein [Trifolium medium]